MRSAEGAPLESCAQTDDAAVRRIAWHSSRRLDDRCYKRSRHERGALTAHVPCEASSFPTLARYMVPALFHIWPNMLLIAPVRVARKQVIGPEERQLARPREEAVRA